MNGVDNYAVVRDGVVENIVIWDGVSPWEPPDGTIAVYIPEDEFVSIGYLYANGQFTAPP